MWLLFWLSQTHISGCGPLPSGSQYFSARAVQLVENAHRDTSYARTHWLNWKNKAFGHPVVSWEWSSHCENTQITFGLISVLTLQAWKKRWFVLRSGRLTGDPDVLEYYKNDHAKKPIRVIDLNLCEQVQSLPACKLKSHTSTFLHTYECLHWLLKPSHRFKPLLSSQIHQVTFKEFARLLNSTLHCCTLRN